MGMYANIGGSKQLTSLYINKDGTSKKLSACYANINGTSKNLLQLVYIWYRYPVTSWEDTHGTHNTFSYDPYNTGDTYHVGYLSIDDGEKVYSSYGFNSSTGLYYGSGSSKHIIFLILKKIQFFIIIIIILILIITAYIKYAAIMFSMVLLVETDII